MHKQVWKGVDSDNDSCISSDQGADDVDHDDDDDDDVAEFEPILEADANVDDDDDHDDKKVERRPRNVQRRRQRRQRIKKKDVQFVMKLQN
jgi:hypothetical protein